MTVNTKSKKQTQGVTLVRDIEKKYKIHLSYPADEKFSTVLKKMGSPTLSRLMDMVDATRQAEMMQQL